MRTPNLSDGVIRRGIGDAASAQEQGVVAQERVCGNQNSGWTNFGRFMVYSCSQLCCDKGTVIVNGKPETVYYNCSNEDCGSGIFYPFAG
jgi:hypothetical protein